jgi:hypothetical protein
LTLRELLRREPLKTEETLVKKASWGDFLQTSADVKTGKLLESL